MKNVALLLLIFVADVLMLLLFAAAICELLQLTHGMVKLCFEVTISLVNGNTENERGGKYDTTTVLFMLLLFDAEVQE